MGLEKEMQDMNKRGGRLCVSTGNEDREFLGFSKRGFFWAIGDRVEFVEKKKRGKFTLLIELCSIYRELTITIHEGSEKWWNN